MAYITLKNGKGIGVTKEQGHEIWSVLQGDREPTPEQEKFIEQVEDVKLSFNNAPDSYIKEHLQEFIAWCKQDWRVDYKGNPVKPQYSEQWELAKKWGF